MKSITTIHVERVSMYGRCQWIAFCGDGCNRFQSPGEDRLTAVGELVERASACGYVFANSVGIDTNAGR